MNILSPFKIKNIILPNRITVASMCQYSAKNGNASTWHYGHLQQLANSGAGMLMLESTAVSMKGRITLKDLALANKENEKSLKNLIKYIRSISKIPLGLQISHAGRKGSAEIPWIKSNHSLSGNNKKWTTCAPSAIKRDSNWPTPAALTILQIKKIVNEFKNSAKRAQRIGFDCLEIHMAHGYLLHQFFSPISNKRKDIYGGALENRCKLLIEIIHEIRKIWPKNKILGARVTADDCLKNGINIDDCIYLVNELKLLGFDYVTPSSGGIIPFTNKKVKPFYQVKYCHDIKKKINIKVYANGMIRTEKEINNIINNNYADFVAVCKPFINDPFWLFKIASKNNKNIDIPKQYSRCF